MNGQLASRDFRFELVRVVSGCAAVVLLWFTMSATLLAQATTADDKDKPLPPEAVTLKTTDDSVVTATYYPSHAGKDAPIILLIHASKGSRADLASLALKLQLAGNAVIAPDLRGHGDSVGTYRVLRPQDYADMVSHDLEAVKGFLMKENNAGKLNIERLGVMGAEMGATLAINWTALDWSWPVLATGKQGQDVKALVLISPEWSFKGVRIGDALAEPDMQREISVLIVTGARNHKLLGEAKRLYHAFGRAHNVSTGQPIESQTLFLKTPATSLQGIALVNEKSLDVDQMILEFVDLRLAKPAFPWTMRKSSL